MDPAELVQWKFRAIEGGIRRLCDARRHQQADQFAGQLAELKNALEQPWKSTPSQQPELHVVCVYEGSPKVHVTYTDAPIVLCVGAYSRVRWSIEVDPDVKIQKVILGGYYPQEISGLPPDTPVLNHCRGAANASSYLRTAYTRKKRGAYADFVKDLKKISGLDVTTFQGAYRSRGTIVVGPHSTAWRVTYILSRIDELYDAATRFARARRWVEMQSLRFHGLHFVDAGGSRTSVSLGEFTPNGPIVATLRPFPAGVDKVVVAPNGSVYCQNRHGVFVIDSDTRRLRELETNPETPHFSWLSSIAFDTKRNRLLASAGSGLYGLDPETQIWTLLTRSALGSAATVYVESEDAVYGLNQARGSDESFSRIGQFAPTGALVRSIRLPEEIWRSGSHDDVVQLCWANGRLVIVISERSHASTPLPPVLKPRCYVVDPKTGQIVYACYMEPQSDVVPSLAAPDYPQTAPSTTPEPKVHYSDSQRTYYSDFGTSDQMVRVQKKSSGGLIIHGTDGPDRLDADEIRRLIANGASPPPPPPVTAEPVSPPAPKAITKPLGDNTELHVVGFYQGADNGLKISRADVRVTKQDAPIVLCLCAYEQVAWNVKVEPGAELAAVLLGGYYHQVVYGLPDDVPVVDRTRPVVGSNYIGYAYAKPGSQAADGSSGRSSRSSYQRTQGRKNYETLAARLKEETGLDIASFQGAYRYEGKPIVVGP